MGVKIKLTNGAETLTRGTSLSTGIDLKARGFSKISKNEQGKNVISEPIWFDDTIKSVDLKPMQRILIKTGVHIEPEPPQEDENGNLFIVNPTIKNRSGLTLKEGVLCNIGVIDIDFRGDISCSLINLSKEVVTISENQAVGQLCFEFATIPKLEYVTELDDDTIRGTGGFGSTDKQ